MTFNSCKGGLAVVRRQNIKERSAIIRFLVNAQKTVWYPVLFAALCVISGTNNYTVYLPILSILCVFVVFSALFADNKMVFIVPMLSIFYCLGSDEDPWAFGSSNGELLASFDENAFKWICIFAAIAIGALVIRLFADGTIASAFKKRGGLTAGIILLDIAFLLNGVFSDVYEPINIWYGVLMCIGFTLFYFLVHGMLEDTDVKEIVPYTCKAMVATAYIALLQFASVAYREWQKGDFFIYTSGGEVDIINRGSLTLSWGVSTVIAAVFILGIPAAMYLAKNHRFGWFSYLSALLFLAGSVVINTRSAIVVGAVAFVFCAIVCCFSGKNKTQNRIYSGILLLIGVASILYLSLQTSSLKVIFDKVMGVLRFDSISESGRWLLWENGIQDFISAPLFGVGFNDGGYPDATKYNNVYSNMYHCIGIEFPAAMGVVGCIAFLIHAVQLAVLFFKKFTADRALILMLPLMILGMSLVDNFFFYLHFQIFYCIFIVIAEKELDAQPPRRKKAKISKIGQKKSDSQADVSAPIDNSVPR